MLIETAGTQVDTIPVHISYRIIELFSAGLYSSPNKAFEELVCNSYDAFADKVAVYVAPDLTVENAIIWVCDNGESMDQAGLKELWRVGESTKRSGTRDKRRLQIGRFGIGKLATYILARKLTYVCKRDGRFLAATMNYDEIPKTTDSLTLVERELTEEEAEASIGPLIHSTGRALVPFSLFGSDAAPVWTFTIMTALKPKAAEIKEGRLKWVLRTALPHSPAFQLHYNGELVESSKVTLPIKRSWILGKDDQTANALGYAQSREVDGKHFIDFDKLLNVSGQIDLYDDSLVDASKSSEQGRSHGIFLMVRGRLVNLDDPLLGMEAFSHGAFNRSRIVVHADELDNNLTSTRETIKDSEPLRQLKEYLKAKFNNEIKKYHYEEQAREDRESSVLHRLSRTSLMVSKRPLLVFAELFFDGKIFSPMLINKPDPASKDTLLSELRSELLDGEALIKCVEWAILGAGEPIARLDLNTGRLLVNMMHPYIANYNDAYKSVLPVQFIAITEVLTEAHLYELGIEESQVNSIMRRRDSTLRELSLSDRESAPAVALFLKDTIADPTGLENAVYRAFLALGFEATKLGGPGKPDGKADAILGYTETEKSASYSITYDSKSTGKDRIQAGTAKLSAIKRHQTDYKADFAVVVAVDFEGGDDPDSAVSKEAVQQGVTLIRVTDLVRLLLLSAPKQISLLKIRQLLESCKTPKQVADWINDIAASQASLGPIKDALETIYEFQLRDTEAPEIASVRIKLNEKVKPPISRPDLKALIESLRVLAPGYISVDGERIWIQARPAKVLEVINGAINQVPSAFSQMYLDAFSPPSKAAK
ncbi:MAG TPA: ATP-binding protein [Kiritimatiellia bacterium]|nr:ATP-binding protein [Kiritimatiellia bacterium]HMP33361.1 ATP-binding protein [Kiritimatiellia bacterium]